MRKKLKVKSHFSQENLLKASKLKLVLVLVALSACGLGLVWSKTLAQSPTPKEEATDAAQTTSEIRQKAQEKILSLKQASNRRGFWGELAEINNSTLILNNPHGERRIKTGEETDYFLGKTEIKFGDLEIGNFIIALGYLDENGTLEAKRIISLKIAPKPAVKRYTVHGNVSDISEDEEILAITHLKKDQTFELQLTSKTIITKKIEGKIKKLTFSDIKVDDRIAAIGLKEGENETITAKLIHLIPGKAEGLEKVTPTPTPEE